MADAHDEFDTTMSLADWPPETSPFLNVLPPTPLIGSSPNPFLRVDHIAKYFTDPEPQTPSRDQLSTLSSGSPASIPFSLSPSTPSFDTYLPSDDSFKIPDEVHRYERLLDEPLPPSMSNHSSDWEINDDMRAALAEWKNKKKRTGADKVKTCAAEDAEPKSTKSHRTPVSAKGSKENPSSERSILRVFTGKKLAKHTPSPSARITGHENADQRDFITPVRQVIRTIAPRPKQKDVLSPLQLNTTPLLPPSSIRRSRL